MKRLNNYLLTHHPLLWNTRVVWVLAVNLLLHLLFFLSGYASVSTRTLQDHYGLYSVGGGNLYTFGVLCSLLVVIVWCVYYLRNNAFKSWYRIGPWYLAKEFGIVFVILLTSITYTLSFKSGASLRIRGITPYGQTVREMNDVNKALVYVPVNRTPYFILNDCENKRRRQPTDPYYYEDRIVPDIDPNYLPAPDTLGVRQALQRPDAFSYRHYCKNFFTSSKLAIDSAEVISARNRQWLAGGQRDSVRQSLLRLIALLNKYGIPYRLDADRLTAAAFRDSLATSSGTVAESSGLAPDYTGQTSSDYLSTYALGKAYGLIEDAHGGPQTHEDRLTEWNVVGYIALVASVVLLCYRRFSKRVFLISIVGTLVWGVLVSLLTVGTGSENGFAWLMLFLTAAFLGTALFSLYGNGGSKTAAGASLSWHAYVVPFAVMLVYALISEYHNERTYRYSGLPLEKEEAMRLYPISTWVTEHAGEIFLANVIVTALYIAFALNRWAKRWHLMPEE